MSIVSYVIAVALRDLLNCNQIFRIVFIILARREHIQTHTAFAGCSIHNNLEWSYSRIRSEGSRSESVDHETSWHETKTWRQTRPMVVHFSNSVPQGSHHKLKALRCDHTVLPIRFQIYHFGRSGLKIWVVLGMLARYHKVGRVSFSVFFLSVDCSVADPSRPDVP